MRYPHLRVENSTSDYHVRTRWMAWTDRDLTRIAGVALFGPMATVQGVTATVLNHPPRAVSWEWDPDDPPLTAAFTAPSWPPLSQTMRRDDTLGPFKIVSTAFPMKTRAQWSQQFLVPESVFPTPGTDRGDTFLQFHWGPADQWPETAWTVLQSLGVPLAPSWHTEFFQALTQAHATSSDPASLPTIEPLPFWAAHDTFAPMPLHFTHLDRLGDWVSTLVRRSILVIPPGTGPNPAVPLSPETTHPDTYLQAWAPALGRQLDTMVVPRHPAGSPRPAAYDILARSPYPAQADVIQAAALTLRDTGSAVIVGEQGTGKTLMMATVPWDLWHRQHQRAGYRVLVIAPDHLVPKWIREIRETIPGATATKIDDWRTVLHQRAAWSRPATHPEYWVLGRDRAKLSYRTHFAAQWSVQRGGWVCPDCGHLLEHPETHHAWAETIKKSRSTRACPFCHTPLWAADKTLRRMGPMQLLRRYATRRFDTVIVDEVHELKGATEQGQVLAWASRVGRTLLAGTGTLASGYADDLHLLQWRLHPASMVTEGLDHNRPQWTLQRYGRVRTVTREPSADTESDKQYGRHAAPVTTTKRLPGISPLWYATKLVDRAVFLTLDDLGADALPAYTETVRWVPMDDDQARWITLAIGILRDAATQALQRGSRRLLGALVSTALTLPDEPWQSLILDHHEHLSYQPSLTPDRVYPKEQAVLDDVLAEIQAGRKVWVYTPYTKTHPQADRLAQLFRDHGLRTAVLTDAVARDTRETWVAQQVRQGVQVVISHPQLVETGLDLLDFPSIFWFATGYNLFRLRQASRRAWRLGQRQPCMVRFYAYQDTMQEQALMLMAQKLDVAKALEGQLSLEGLQTVSNDTGSLDLARVLVQGLETTIDVSAVWKTAAAAALPIPAPPCKEPDFPSSPPSPASDPVVVPWAALTRRKRRVRPAADDPNQISFGF